MEIIFGLGAGIVALALILLVIHGVNWLVARGKPAPRVWVRTAPPPVWREERPLDQPSQQMPPPVYFPSAFSHSNPPITMEDYVQLSEEEVLRQKRLQKIRSDRHYQLNRERVIARSKARRQRMKEQRTDYPGLYTPS